MGAIGDSLTPGMLLDGGIGTELIGCGLDLSVEPPEVWNATRAEEVRKIQRRYLQAGAEALQTNSFGGNRLCLQRYGRSDEVRTLNLAAAAIARQAGATMVIGSIGPTGVVAPPEGDANLVELELAFAEQASALAEGGVDLLHIETMYHPKEARAAIRGCRSGAPHLPIIASMTCRHEGPVFATGIGYSPETMLQTFIEEGADGVGVNCTLAPVDMLDLVRLLHSRTRLPVIAKPTIAPTHAAPLLPGEFATGVLALLAVGATAVGGCCGTGPADISAARAALDKHAHSATAQLS